MTTRRIPDPGPCIMCGKATRQGVEWHAGPPLAMHGGRLTFFYCGCWGDAARAWPLIAYVLELALLDGGYSVAMVGCADGMIENER